MTNSFVGNVNITPILSPGFVITSITMITIPFNISLSEKLVSQIVATFTKTTPPPQVVETLNIKGTGPITCINIGKAITTSDLKNNRTPQGNGLSYPEGLCKITIV